MLTSPAGSFSGVSEETTMISLPEAVEIDRPLLSRTLDSFTGEPASLVHVLPRAARGVVLLKNPSNDTLRRSAVVAALLTSLEVEKDVEKDGP